jgi:hypothetical protein
MLAELHAGRITPIMGLPEGNPRPFTLDDVPEGYTVR